MFCRSKTKPKVSEKRGNRSEFHSERNYYLQNCYFSRQSEKKLLRSLGRFEGFLVLSTLICRQKYHLASDIKDRYMIRVCCADRLIRSYHEDPVLPNIYVKCYKSYPYVLDHKMNFVYFSLF